jgi:uncharacterized protein YgbK (DUF1537 family)
MSIIGAVADDLTGATTVGVLLARAGFETAAFFNESAINKDDVASSYKAVIVSSNSRALSTEEAYSKVSVTTQSLKNLGVKQFSKRIDTTMRGGIGVEIDAMLDQLSSDTVAIMVPAMPQSSRILVGGYSIINGTALSKTPVANDVRTPVKETYIPNLIAKQSRRKVDTVTLTDVLGGVDSIKKALFKCKECGAKIIIVDAITLEDIEMIARAVTELAWDIIAVDPGPFTEKLAFVKGWAASKNNVINDTTNCQQVEKGTVLVVAGSASPVTEKQIRTLCDNPGTYQISLETKKLVNKTADYETEIEKASEKAISAILSEESPRVIVIETALNGKVLNLSEEEKKFELTCGSAANNINAALGRIVANILNKANENVVGLYMTGGDTMVNVCYQLGAECIELIDYVIPQADIGRLTGNYKGMPVVGKGGLTGTDSTAVDIVNRLFKEAKRK